MKCKLLIKNTTADGKYEKQLVIESSQAGAINLETYMYEDYRDE